MAIDWRVSQSTPPTRERTNEESMGKTEKSVDDAIDVTTFGSGIGKTGRWNSVGVPMLNDGKT